VGPVREVGKVGPGGHGGLGGHCKAMVLASLPALLRHLAGRGGTLRAWTVLQDVTAARRNSNC
jgi:hypothetical protein